MWGCSTEKSTRPASQSGYSKTASNSGRLAPVREAESALQDSLISDPTYDAEIAGLIKRARFHHAAALSAEQEGDSARAAAEFENAIAILNKLGYYPTIESNCDFEELSHAVVEDYQKYIAVIDSLGPQASISALRNKLNQIDEAVQGVEQDVPKEVIRTVTVPLVINGHVEQNIHYLQGRGRGHFEHWLYMAGRFFPIMRKAFRDEGVPEELVYLSMIESGLNPVAHSWARAVGLWQFVKGTGRLYGLDGNFWYDGRRDFEKATHAAARHLKDLHSEFGDWYLSLAAYNSGAGRVHRAIHRSKSTDFWKMRRHLPRETRNYVPQFIAAAVMGLNPGNFGFDVAPAAPLSFETVQIDECVDLAVLARCAGTDVEMLRELNPELIQWCTPPAMKGYSLRIPAGTSSMFAANYAKVPDEQKRDWLVHTVKRGQSLAAIAKKYGIPASLLAEVNHLSSSRRVRTGKSLVIPVSGASTSISAYPVEVDTREHATRSKRHKKKSVNRVPLPDRAATLALQDTQKDAGGGKKSLSYKVKRGDTLYCIASTYRVSVAKLRSWNNIRGTRIRIGQALVINS